MRALASDADLDALLAQPGPAWLLKHSTACGVSAAAHAEVADYAAHHPDEPVAVVVVQTHRPLPTAVAQRLALPHQSPQLLLLRGGRLVWHASHWAISAAAMEAARRDRAGA